MVDYNDAKAVIRLREHGLKAQIDKLYASKLDALTARMYADDADIRRGGYSMPCNQYRPGQRDDEMTCQFIKFMPAL